MKKFNVTGPCFPDKHYMVDISDRLRTIRGMVDDGDYFCINRGRQYGKTTTLKALVKYLAEDYLVLPLDFQAIPSGRYESGETFSKAMAGVILTANEWMGVEIPTDCIDAFKRLESNDKDYVDLDSLFKILRKWCASSDRPIVMMIDEVDSASNNQVFLDFLAQLRLDFINRDQIPTFQSVILAGVTDIKHLKSKIRDESQHKVNSPWNIAVNFEIDMTLRVPGIKTMLDEYAKEHDISFDSEMVARAIYDYTHGYPFLVSRICQLIDTKLVPEVFQELSLAWTQHGVDEAVRLIMYETNTLFDSLVGKVEAYPELKGTLREILMEGEDIDYNPYDVGQSLLFMYGFIRNKGRKIVIFNSIFEMLLYRNFISEARESNKLLQSAAYERKDYVSGRELNVPYIMERFIKYFNEIHGGEISERFLEKEAREKFLIFLSPIINGSGTFSIEEETRDHKRMDVCIHYMGKRYVIELKIWRGERYNEKGEAQILQYLDHFGLDTGYLLSFSFNKEKEPGVKKIRIGERVLYEGTA
ncbi:MAG: 9-O-acetyl-N-acetylneuraminate esterase [Lachnospiraceae bacterium]|nr:9-O-acetyl-N-acetylneuraminate esterase [Lachnospiraceae bacterium]